MPGGSVSNHIHSGHGFCTYLDHMTHGIRVQRSDEVLYA